MQASGIRLNAHPPGDTYIIVLFQIASGKKCWKLTMCYFYVNEVFISTQQNGTKTSNHEKLKKISLPNKHISNHNI